MTRIPSVFNLLKRLGFAVLLLGCGSVSLSQRLQWDPAGMPVLMPKYVQHGLNLSSDGGSYLTAWSDSRSGYSNIYAQRIATDGTFLWGDEGIAVTEGSGFRKDPVIVPSGDHYLVVWSEGAGGEDVYAQKLDADGETQWDGLGIRVSSISPDLCHWQSIEVIPDGFEGHYIAWIGDDRTQMWVMVNHIDEIGTLLFPEPLTLTQASLIAGLARTNVVETNGDLLLGFRLYGENPYPDFYLAKIGYDGTLPWGEEGYVPVCINASNKDNLQLVLDDSRQGVFCFWDDRRSGGNTSNIWMQHIGPDGEISYSANGEAVCQIGGSRASIRACASMNQGVRDGILLFWLDRRTGLWDLYAHKLSLQGEDIWPSGGVQVCSGGAPLDRNWIHLNAVSNNSGGLLAIWQREYEGTFFDADIVVKQLDSTGTPVGQGCGDVLTAASSSIYELQVLSTDNQLVVNFVNEPFTTQELMIQALDLENWTLPWGPDGLVTVPFGTGYGLSDRYETAVASLSSGNFVVVWQDSRQPNSASHLFFQILESNGRPIAPVNGKSVTPEFSGTDSLLQYLSHSSLLPDAQGGFLIAYSDSRADAPLQVRLTHIGSNLEYECDSIGVAVHASGTQQFNPVLATDSMGAVYLSFYEYDHSLSSIGYVMRVQADCSIDSASFRPIAPDFENSAIHTMIGLREGCIVVWEAPQDNEAFCTRLDRDCGEVWSARLGEGPIYSSEYDVVAHDGIGGIYATINREENGVPRVFVQHIDSSGAVLWGPEGLPATEQAYEQHWPTLTTTSDHDLVVSWTDFRIGISDIYGQRISALGERLWSSDGVVLGGGPGNELYSQLISADSGGFYVLWDDCRNIPDCDYRFARDLYGIHLDRNGNLADPLWHPGGDKICELLTTSIAYRATSDNAGGAFVSWIDTRSAEYYFQTIYGVYSQRIGQHHTSAFDPHRSSLPSSVVMADCYPNPANSTTTIEYQLNKVSHVQVRVLNTLGQLVAMLEDDVQLPGKHRIMWDGHSNTYPVASGVYFVQMVLPEAVYTKKFVLLR